MCHLRKIEIDQVEDVRTMAVFNTLLNERNLEFKKTELMAHCAGDPKAETLNELVTGIYNLSFPWKEIVSSDEKQNLIDMLRENY